jgi:KaiC/GvpD/RAD55 family RecA-like ATPase
MSEPVDTADTCDFCRHEISRQVVEGEFDGQTYRFCSESCRDALADGQFVFSEYHGYRRMETGISGLDARLPQGMPRNSLVLVAGIAGTRSSAIEAELVWRALQRGEPAVAVVYTEPPGSFVQGFLELDWNVLPYLEAGQLRVVDCFTDRLEDRERMHDRMNRWNRHLHHVSADATETVRDASDLSEVHNKLDGCLEDSGMSDEGIVVVDSLTELGSLVQPVQAYNFVKDARAEICKGRYVPLFASATYQGEAAEFPHDLDYMVDGIVQLEQNGDLVRDTLIKRLRIRKMNDALSYSEWTAYEYTSGLGMVTFDPREQLDGDDSGKGDKEESEQGSSSPNATH